MLRFLLSPSLPGQHAMVVGRRKWWWRCSREDPVMDKGCFEGSLGENWNWKIERKIWIILQNSGRSFENFQERTNKKKLIWLKLIILNLKNRIQQKKTFKKFFLIFQKDFFSGFLNFSVFFGYLKKIFFSEFCRIFSNFSQAHFSSTQQFPC